MAWYFQWSDSLKKRACRYLLQRYLGQYLQEKLTLDQLSVDLYNGTGTITDLNLDVEGLNEMADTFNLPIEFVDGYIRSISVSIPWSALLKDSSFVEVQGLMATIQPKQRSGSVSLVNSMWGSMTTSMQLAEECLRQDAADSEQDTDLAKPFEGLERFAQTIESVLCRTKVRFIDTIFRLEHVPKGSHVGVALELHIKKVDFFDEAGTEGGLSCDAEGRRNVHEPAAFTCKYFHLEGVTLHTDEFPSRARTFSKSVLHVGSSTDAKNLEAYSTAPDTPEVLTQHSVFESCFGNVDPLVAATCEPSAAAPNATVSQSDPILVAKLSGRHEIRLQVKQCDAVSGPKASVDCSFGSVVVFSSPRQVHVLLDLCRGLVSPDSEDDSNMARHYISTSKPMMASDFDRVEQELQKHLKPRVPGRCIHPQQGWSSQSLEDSDEEFHPVDGPANRMTASVASNASSSQVSDGDSMMSSGSARHSPGGYGVPKVGARRQPQHGSLHLLVEDAMADVTHLKVQLSSLAVVVLHENVLTPASDGSGLVTRSSVLQMKAQGDAFFAELGVFSLAGCVDRNFASAHEKLSSVCQANHLRFIAAPVTIEGNEKTSSTVVSLNVTLSLGTAELVECLFDKKSFSSHPVCPEYSTLLGFNVEAVEGRDKLYSSPFPSYSEPCIRIKIGRWEHPATTSTKLRRMSKPPRTDVSIFMTSCHSEVDISIVDRISSLLDYRDLCRIPTGSDYSPTTSAAVLQPTNQGYLNLAVEETTSPGTEHKVDLSVSASKATVYLRFPVPDMRPLHDMDRMPWWKRAVRSDVLTLEMTEARVHVVFFDGEPCRTVEMHCQELHGLFQESAADPPISFLHASPGNGTGVDNSARFDEGFDWPRLIVKVRPPTPVFALEEQEPDDPDDVMQGSMLDTLVHDLCSSDGGEPSPFSARRVIYKSEHAGNGEPEGNGNGGRRRANNYVDSEQMVLPGERSEAAEFIERSTSNSEFVVELNLANFNVVLPSKHFFEVLYNRITTDLVLWDRAVPRPAAKEPTGQQPPPLNHAWTNSYMHETVYQTFSMCKSALRCDSSSESDEEGPVYMSYREHGKRLKRPTTGKNFCRQNKVCFLLTSKQAGLTLRTPLRDSANKVIPEHHGEIQLQVADVSFFVVSTAPGSPTTCFMCLHAHRVAVYHSGVLATNLADYTSQVGPSTLSPPGHLFPTLYSSEDGIRMKQATTPGSASAGGGGDNPDMLLVAIKISLDATRRVKTFSVALGVRNATLRYHVAPQCESCFTQFMDFFSVVDYPVMGYKTPEVITELHLHTWGCAVDYRPLYLPLRVVLTVEAFTICSNIAAQTSTSVIRVILEDTCLFLSKDLDADCVDLKRYYVCVVDVSFFELSLRLSDAKDQRQPKVDLRASNNLVNIRTCVDSCRALQDLMGYFASDGDLRDLQDFSTETVTAVNSEPYFSDEREMNTLTNVEAEQVHSLMAEAMKESATNSRASSESENAVSNSEALNGDVFLFPDESRLPPQRASPTSMPAAAAAAGWRDGKPPNSSSPSSDSLDDDFCILENDPGVGIVSRSGEPQVRILTTSVPVAVENYFAVPLGRTDQLKAPKHFPMPVLRYTLREVSLIWHMYGGNDFPGQDQGNSDGATKCHGRKTRPVGSPDAAATRHTDSISRITFRDTGSFGVTFSKSNPGEVQWRRPQQQQQHLQLASPSARRAASDSAAWWTGGGPGRQHDVLMELQMNKVRFQHEKYPEAATQASRQVLLIHDVEIRDRLAASQMNKFLYLYSSESMPRQSHANMVVVKALHLRPDATGSSQECALKVSLLPLRLNVDQDALLFLYNFFGSLSAERSEGQGGSGGGADFSGGEPPALQSKAPAVSHQVPVMSVAPASPPQLSSSVAAASSRNLDSQNLMLLLEESLDASSACDSRLQLPRRSGDGHPAAALDSSSEAAAVPVFFRSFVFSPEVPIRLDYHGKRVDMEQGALAGLVMGLGQLNCSELCLKRLSYRHGLLGVDRLLAYALGEWLQDIRQTQLPGVLGGVGPLHSLVQLFQGMRDLFWLPIEQYRKDGRIMRGLQRGANAFTTSTAMAALELANRLVQAVQCVSETAYDVVSPGPSVRSQQVGGRPRHKRPSQPADIREGMANAFQVVREGLGDTARTLVQVASEEHEQKGISGAVGGVLRQIPPTVVKPIILASEATSNVLGGMKHQLAPDVRREAAEKWRSDDC